MFTCCYKKYNVFIRRVWASFKGWKALSVKQCILILMAIIFLAPASPIASTLSPIAQEDKIKAVYIFNFIRFTEWGEGFITAPDNQTNLAIWGNELLLQNFKEKAFQSTAFGERLNAYACDDIRSCSSTAHALFIDNSKRSSLNEVINLLSNKPILTISDIPGFAEQGGMIELKRDNGRIIFRINLEAIKRAHLYVSSQLLQMAEIIEKKP